MGDEHMPPIWKKNSSNDNPLGYRKHEVSIERINQIQDYLISKTLRVYCNTSYRPNEGIYGIGCSFVGFNSVIVHNDKLYSKLVGQSILGELYALRFAFLQLTSHITTVQKPEEVIIFSSALHLLGNGVRKYNEMLDPLISEINSLHHQARESVGINIEIQNLGTEKRHNPFAKSAYNASRKAIGL